MSERSNVASPRRSWKERWDNSKQMWRRRLIAGRLDPGAIPIAADVGITVAISVDDAIAAAGGLASRSAHRVGVPRVQEEAEVAGFPLVQHAVSAGREVLLTHVYAGVGAAARVVVFVVAGLHHQRDRALATESRFCHASPQVFG